MARYFVIIPAAGSGSRFSFQTPKQYKLLAGKPILTHIIHFFLSFPFIEKIIVPISEQDTTWSTLNDFPKEKVLSIVGGEERCHSVLNALSFLKEYAKDTDWVLVHDAARPCLSESIFLSLINTLKNHPVGGILGIPVSDTLKKVNPEKQITQTLKREALWQAQTPQMFKYGLLYSALKESLAQKKFVTDESMAMEQAGFTPAMVLGSPSNFKITWSEDFEIAEYIFQKILATREPQ